MSGLSVQQFRTLNYLRKHPKSSLSRLALHLGLSLPSTSKLVQQLVAKQVITRRCAADRRRISLSLTRIGIAALTTASLETQQQLAENLSSLNETELQAVFEGLHVLKKAFVGGASGVSIP
jgi:MarR family transcriptional regulator for hemolysin